MGENEEFASCHILRFRNIKRANAPLSLIQFYVFVPNQVVVVVLQILSIMGGGVEENTLTWPSHRYSPWLIYLQNEKL